MPGFWYFSIAVGLLLHIVVIRGILRNGSHRVYPFLFAFCLADFLSSVLESSAFLGVVSWKSIAGELYATYYWGNEFALQLLIFVLMLSMIHRAMEGLPHRWLLILSIAFAVTSVSILSVPLTYSSSSSFTRWMTDLSGKLSFFSALLNVVLWSALLRNRNRSRQLLVIAAGLGLLTAGKSIGHHLRGWTPQAVPYADAFIVLSQLLCLLVWCWAFYRVRDPLIPNIMRGASQSSAVAGRR